ncbi:MULTISPECIES: GNAT family N-acetyltransferase [unclassified Pseudoalteromonas]|uniref:GNAT family N-acetyltransferase n=1 Tax=unclassified Pseudoalteromonas TaxID=194690 RepID=UPI000C084480|nr:MULTISPECIES: GNAT family N-acetyltransferase [unclassified Pseudoalteromonas]MDP2635980.1 GNAT family N-acetyltransferase [Pseudoalteromonas sp. 1_MG-2023]PHN89950.1 acetyltransferase [Pseudoalteromonas sp. 3D05]
MLLKHHLPIEKSPSGVVDHYNNISLQGEICFGYNFVAEYDENIHSLPQLLCLLDALFYLNDHIKHVQLPKKQWQQSKPWQALVRAFNTESLSRFEFYSHPLNGLNETQRPLFNHIDSQRMSPKRPINLTQEVYRRFDNELGKFISFKVADPDADIGIFHQWMHHPRVSEFWEMDLPKEELKSYLTDKFNTPFNLPLIGYFDDEAFGYFEVYWAAEDRIAPYYAWQGYDRGLHLLVGNDAYRGTRFFKAWCKAISHFIFLDCPMTQKIVLEPRHDNQKLFNQITKLGFIKEYEFEFPHKRAALISIEKVKFYKENFQC